MAAGDTLNRLDYAIGMCPNALKPGLLQVFDDHVPGSHEGQAHAIAQVGEVR